VADQLLVGTPVLVVVDIQEGAFSEGGAIPVVDDYSDRMRAALPLVEAARAARVPVVFIQEAHRRSGVDFGRELDGAEGVHCLEDDPETEVWREFGVRPEEPVVVKRGYSAFFETELSSLLRGLSADTLVLCGGLTDVCVHYTFVDAHQHGFRVRVAKDAVAGSSVEAHDHALAAMAYLQSAALTDVKTLSAAFGEGSPERGTP
jgi:nicotinamidase-related amidase